MDVIRRKILTSGRLMMTRQREIKIMHYEQRLAVQMSLVNDK